MARKSLRDRARRSEARGDDGACTHIARRHREAYTVGDGFANHDWRVAREPSPLDERRESISPPARVRRVVQQWVLAVVHKDLSITRKLHPNLQKALAYLSENFSEQVSLGQLAKHACISPSHLAYLFKSAFGVSFKPFLGKVRIEKAKQLLVEEAPVRITNVALDVGFMDLSHFEKLFKRIVGMNAREYRRRSLSAQQSVAAH